MKETVAGSLLLVGAIGLRILNGYQSLDWLVSSLNHYGASAVADALQSSVFLTVCGLVGVGLIWDGSKRSRQLGGQPSGGGFSQERAGDGDSIQAGRDVYYNSAPDDTRFPPRSTSAERYAKEQAEAKARFHESRLKELKNASPQESSSEPDPQIRVECVNGREAVLIVTASRPTRLKAQARIMDVAPGELERGDPYPVLWREPGQGYTIEYQEVARAKTAVIVLARTANDANRIGPSSVEILGDTGAVQTIHRQAGDPTPVTVEISVNIFGGAVGRLVHAFHYIVMVMAESNIVTVRPVERPTVTTPAEGIELSRS